MYLLYTFIYALVYSVLYLLLFILGCLYGITYGVFQQLKFLHYIEGAGDILHAVNEVKDADLHN